MISIRQTLIGRACYGYLVLLYTYSKQNACEQLLYCRCCCSRTRISIRLQRSDLEAVDSPGMYDHVYHTLRYIWSVFLIELTTLGRIITLQQASLHSICEHKYLMTCRIIPRNIFSPGFLTIWYQERSDTPRGRAIDPRRERGKGRQPPSKAWSRGSNRRMAAHTARESGESGSMQQGREIEPRREKNKDRVCRTKIFFAEQQQRNRSPGPKKNINYFSSRPS